MTEYRITAPCAYLLDGKAYRHSRPGAVVDLPDEVAARLPDCLEATEPPAPASTEPSSAGDTESPDAIEGQTGDPVEGVAQAVETARKLANRAFEFGGQGAPEKPKRKRSRTDETLTEDTQAADGD